MHCWNVNLLHAARWKYRTQNLRRQNSHLCTIAQLCRAISSQLRHVSTIGKILSNNGISSTYTYNMVNFGPPTAEIGSLVLGTPANFNGFRVLASLLQRRRFTEANQTLHAVWPSPGLVYIYTYIYVYIHYIFGGCCYVTEFCQVQASLCVQVLRSLILAALLHRTRIVGISQTLRSWAEGATYVRQGGHHVRLAHIVV